MSTPVCTLDETLAVVANAFVCVGVNCSTKYGLARPVWNATLGLCTATAPGGGGNSTALGCVHGVVTCAASCVCTCDAGWSTPAVGATLPTVFCNATSNGFEPSAAPAGPLCGNVVACFFTNQLPYAIAVCLLVLLVASLLLCCAKRCCCPNTTDIGR